MKALALLLCLAAVGLLSACGGDDSSDPGVSNAGNEDLFTTSGFEKAYDAAVEKAGDDALVLRLQVTEAGASFQVFADGLPSAFTYTGGELVDQELQVIGSSSIERNAFSIGELDPDAIDRIVDGVTDEAGSDDVEVTGMTLEKRAGDSELRWVITASGAEGVGQVFSADPSGEEVSAGDVSTASDCIAQAGGDPAEIQGCSN